MQGAKLATAKAAAWAVLEQLGIDDRAALVVFDSEVETILPEGPMTDQRKAEAKARLAEVEARASTALYDGWLTGCHAIAPETAGSTRNDTITRCFLLTDGQANVGLQDPEAIAAQAAEVRSVTGIGTSTFGIGEDYDEGLLAPMAVAGSGQFHHLRTEAEIASTFSGELGELFNVTARGVVVELELPASVRPELISLYRAVPQESSSTIGVEVGDLIAGEVRHLVFRLQFLGLKPGQKATIRSRIVGQPWNEVQFTCAEHSECDAETRSHTVMHWVGLQHAQKAKKAALDLFRDGDPAAAIKFLGKVVRRLQEYASPDKELMQAVEELKTLQKTYEENRMSVAEAKEQMYQSVSSSRMQRDHRNP